MVNRLFYTAKFNSSLLAEFDYNLNMSFKEAMKDGMIISLADSQMLKTIRILTNHEVNLEFLEKWYEERDFLKKHKNCKENRNRIKELQNNIYTMMYIPEYISVVMESKKHYEQMFKKGFLFNGKKYVRFSCSASQARVSTVIFIEESIKEKAKEMLDNGRNLYKPLIPSKYSAYFGLYSSAIHEVTKPRFCVISDYCTQMDVDVSYIVETDIKEDDKVEDRTISVEKNWFDGSGLISPQFASQWAEDMQLDYVPCQFCIRYSFIKGMVNEFDFIDWCNEENDGNYLITDIYGKQIDLRNIDVILTEGQFKLWDSWDSQEEYEECCAQNKLVFGVTRPAPKEDKKVLILNYQFIQTLNLKQKDIEALCADTVKYIQGVSYDDIYYTLLFLMGENISINSIESFLQNSDNYWLKSLVYDPSLFYDKYSKEKVREYIIRRIEQACLGKIIVRGNFEAIVPDGFAFMQWATGHEVTGLLKAKEFYSQFWQQYNVQEVDCMRSPMTHFSEHYVVDLKNDERMKKWFKYSYSGIIVNCHDNHTMSFAGSDYDFDILATTDSKPMINCVYPNQRVVTYATPKGVKKIFTEEDLYKCDLATFDSLIGAITNIATTLCALLPVYPKDSEEYNLISNRIKMCCASQSRQIDKAKIGRKVKGIVPMWRMRQKIFEEDSQEEKNKKEFYNSILCDKKPYFFRYKYDYLDKGYKSYIKAKTEDCLLKFDKPLSEVLENPQTEEEQVFKNKYYRFLDIVDSDCVMNMLCHYIENIDFSIKQKVRSSQGFDYHDLMDMSVVVSDEEYKKITQKTLNTIKEWAAKQKELTVIQKKYGRTGLKYDDEEVNAKDLAIKVLKDDLLEINSNERIITNALVKLFYEEKVSLNKNLLWKICGKQIAFNLQKKTSTIYFPVKDKSGTLEYLYENYSVQRYDLTKLGEENHG